MFDRVRKYLRQFFQSKTKKSIKSNADSRTNYSDLPVEMKREIAKQADILTRYRLRQCSKQDLEIVDSINFKIPIVKFKTNECHNVVAISILEGVEKVSTIYFWLDDGNVDLRPVIYCNNEIMNISKYGKPERKQSTLPFDIVIKQLFQALSQKNVRVGQVMIEFYGIPLVSNLVKQYFVVQSPTKIMTRCPKTYANCQNDLPMDYSTVFDLFRLCKPDGIGKIAFAGNPGHPYVEGCELALNKFHTLIVQYSLAEFVNNLYLDLDRISNYFWMPSWLATREDYKQIVKICSNVTIIEKSEDSSLLWLPNPSYTKGLLVKMSKCGVVIEKLPIEADTYRPNAVLNGCARNVTNLLKAGFSEQIWK